MTELIKELTQRRTPEVRQEQPTKDIHQRQVAKASEFARMVYQRQTATLIKPTVKSKFLEPA